MTSRALVLYGRVGTYDKRAAQLSPDVPGDMGLWHSCATTIRKHVVKPWEATGVVDVFVQSWNPTLAAHMDAYWRPRASDHARQLDVKLPRCPVKLGYCERTLWALLGMKRALALRRQWNASRGHALVMVMRHDIRWFDSLPPLVTDASVRLWMAMNCGCDTQPGSVARSAATHLFGRSCTSEPRFCESTVISDLWWAGDAELADDFETTYDSFANYSRIIRYEFGFPNSSPHHYWGLFFFRTHRIRQKCQLGFVGSHLVHFTLGRHTNAPIAVNCPIAVWDPRHKIGSRHCKANNISGYMVQCPID